MFYPLLGRKLILTCLLPHSFVSYNFFVCILNCQFGKQWFKPEEASGLRAKIRNVLIKEFKKASEVECISETLSPSSSDAQEEWI